MMTDLPVEVEEVRVLRLQPGDVIIAKVSDRVTQETVLGVRQNLEGSFPGYRVIVVSGIDLEVPRTSRAVDLAVAERTAGPILLGRHGRLDRYEAYRIVRRIGRKAGIAHAVHPHALRHAFCTAALDAGAPLRDVQEAMSHSDPRTTSRYDRHRVSLDRHVAYSVATFVAGATNGR